MTDDIAIFDRRRVRMNRDRAARQNRMDGNHHAFLHEWAGRSLLGRLQDIRHNFETALVIGANGTNPLLNHPKIGTLIHMDLSAGHLRNTPGMRLQGDEEFLPLAPQSLDLVVSLFSLHTINDLPGALIQIRQALKPDGLFLAAMLGGETLHELRHVMMEAETSLRGGISPRISPFADKPQSGALLQRAGFALPVVDSDIISVSYDNAFKLMCDIRLMGEGNAIIQRDRRYSGRDLFMETARLYQERFSGPDGRINATFEVIFLAGWAPHESQQKPLPRGSAQTRLADILDTTENSI